MTFFKSGIRDSGPGLFFFISITYLAFLIGVGWFASDSFSSGVLGGILPIGVPWFGALGAVTISLYGVFSHNKNWDTQWNYWHLARPFVGTILGAIAYLILFGVVRATSPAGAAPDSLIGQEDTQIPYYVLAFIVGFREATFRRLITRATDLLLGAEPRADAATEPRADVATEPLVSPSRVDFEPESSSTEKIVMVKPAWSDVNRQGREGRMSTLNYRIVPANSAFTASVPDGFRQIRAGGSRAVVVTFSPAAGKPTKAQLVVDIDGESAIVALAGPDDEG
jgi:hypothetical protein